VRRLRSRGKGFFGPNLRLPVVHQAWVERSFANHESYESSECRIDFKSVDNLRNAENPYFTILNSSAWVDDRPEAYLTLLISMLLRACGYLLRATKLNLYNSPCSQTCPELDRPRSYASKPLITLDFLVILLSRCSTPWEGKVRCLWSKPIRCIMVAWRSCTETLSIAAS